MFICSAQLPGDPWNIKCTMSNLISHVTSMHPFYSPSSPQKIVSTLKHINRCSFSIPSCQFVISIARSAENPPKRSHKPPFLRGCFFCPLGGVSWPGSRPLRVSLFIHITRPLFLHVCLVTGLVRWKRVTLSIHACNAVSLPISPITFYEMHILQDI